MTQLVKRKTEVNDSLPPRFQACPFFVSDRELNIRYGVVITLARQLLLQSISQTPTDNLGASCQRLHRSSNSFPFIANVIKPWTSILEHCRSSLNLWIDGFSSLLYNDLLVTLVNLQLENQSSIKLVSSSLDLIDDLGIFGLYDSYCWMLSDVHYVVLEKYIEI